MFCISEVCLYGCAHDICVNMKGRRMGADIIGKKSMKVPKHLFSPPTFQSTTVSFHFQGHFRHCHFTPAFYTRRPGNTREPALQVPEACRMPHAACRLSPLFHSLKSPPPAALSIRYPYRHGDLPFLFLSALKAAGHKCTGGLSSCCRPGAKTWISYLPLTRRLKRGAQSCVT